MGDTERQLRWALMDTDSWHCWGYTDHQGTLMISALMISPDSSRGEKCR
ncbi:unnamed protein product [Staurois parvus]|uniref:Uncharacterized protein n=1 Tax=Staurois parvus TaxID=386267 RepID=A0ABN9D561_9NEOB|nr:unnamed protein product [Staurois parvus]